MCWLLVAGIALAVAATASAYAASAAPARARAGSRYLDSTYSCRVRKQHYFDVDASVTLPPVQDYPQPAQVSLYSVQKTVTVQGKYHRAVPQVSFTAVQKSLRVDGLVCNRSSRHFPLKPGLPFYETATRSLRGHVDERCVLPKRDTRVLVRFKIELKNATPQQALVAIRTDDAKRKPIEFLDWTPRKIRAYVGNCVDMP